MGDIMKSDLIYLLSCGPKSEIELAAFFGAENLALVMSIIDELKQTGCVEASYRQVKAGNNHFQRAIEYRLLMNTISAA